MQTESQAQNAPPAPATTPQQPEVAMYQSPVIPANEPEDSEPLILAFERKSFWDN